MHIFIDNKEFWLDSSHFNEKISHLKKIKQIKFQIHLYNSPSVSSKEFDFTSKIMFLKSISTLGTIYVSKSQYYWWSFESCQLIDSRISEDKDYFDYIGRDQKKWDIELTISYKDVWGSNKKSVLERDLKLNKLFD